MTLKYPLLLCLLSLLQQIVCIIKEDNALNFLVLGDFGNYATNASVSYVTFDRIESYIQSSRETIDGVLNTGDTMYAKSLFFPTPYEIQGVFDIFTSRKALSQLPIYHIRGNHDFEYDYSIYQGFSKLHPNFLVRDKYYYELFDLKDGTANKVLMVFLDSTIMLCGHSLKGHWFNCTNEHLQETTQQVEWMRKVFQTYENDTTVVWRSVVMHHPFFSKKNPDRFALIKFILEDFMRFKVDFVLSGHDHMQMHTVFSRDADKTQLQQSEVFDFAKNQSLYHPNQQWVNQTMFAERASGNILTFNKSENLLHQIIEGSGGRDVDPLWLEQPSRGTYSFIQGQYYGFSHIKISTQQVEYKLMSAQYSEKDNLSKQPQYILDQYTIIIKNDI